MKKALSEATHFLLLCLLVSACTIDYDVDIPSSSINKLVLSACLETESPIICKFYTCKSNDKYDPAKEVNVTLKEDGDKNTHYKLTGKENLIRTMLDYGYSKAAICRKLKCNPKTLDDHLRRMHVLHKN